MPAAAPPRRPAVADRQPRKATSIRLTAEADRLLDELEQHLGISRSAVIEFSIREVHRLRLGGTEPEPEKKPKKRKSGH
jgi:hypothetical protein